MLRMRIQAAAEALARTHDSIDRIAFAHGFCDQSAFTQQFRKRTGLTPRQFRSRHRT
jgi:AraC-like DNA-binding protein